MQVCFKSSKRWMGEMGRGAGFHAFGASPPCFAHDVCACVRVCTRMCAYLFLCLSVCLSLSASVCLPMPVTLSKPPPLYLPPLLSREVEHSSQQPLGASRPQTAASEWSHHSVGTPLFRRGAPVFVRSDIAGSSGSGGAVDAVAHSTPMHAAHPRAFPDSSLAVTATATATTPLHLHSREQQRANMGRGAVLPALFESQDQQEEPGSPQEETRLGTRASSSSFSHLSPSFSRKPRGDEARQPRDQPQQDSGISQVKSKLHRSMLGQLSL